MLANLTSAAGFLGGVVPGQVQCLSDGRLVGVDERDDRRTTLAPFARCGLERRFHSQKVLLLRRGESRHAVRSVRIAQCRKYLAANAKVWVIHM